MISIKVNDLKKKINKTIAEISQQTGIHRNTLSALFNEKTSSISFEVLNQLCANYFLDITDILEYRPDNKIHGLYRQEGLAIPISVMMPYTGIGNANKKYFCEQLDNCEMFIKQDYGFWYFHSAEAASIAREAYARYGNRNSRDLLWAAYEDEAKKLENIYYETIEIDLRNLNNNELIELHNRLYSTYKGFWGISLFIDSFDPGFDQEIINNISGPLNLSLEDIISLTSPALLTFEQERILDLLKVAKRKVQKAKRSLLLKEHVKNFGYVKTSYAGFIDYSKEAKNELDAFLQIENLDDRIAELENFSKKQKQKCDKILHRLKLKENPLAFFQLLTYWREHRKKFNLMGLTVLFNILNAVEKKTGISAKYLGYLIPEELPLTLNGLISQQNLKKRREEGILITSRDGKQQVYIAAEATSLHQDLLTKIMKQDNHPTISGIVASQGYARGIARIILGKKDFDKFNEGEILVTGMTRPEYLPLMRMAAGIVTNEGGVTCHAAIVSRELGKPCIIGTRKATEMIKDGDLIEVRANHGTVRIIKKA